MHRCTAVVEFREEIPLPYPPTDNDEELYEHAKRVGEILLGEPNVQLVPITMGAEDFSFYSQKVPAVMFELGIKNETLKSDQPLHSPYFVIDETALPIGAALHAAVAISYLDSHAADSVLSSRFPDFQILQSICRRSLVCTCHWRIIKHCDAMLQYSGIGLPSLAFHLSTQSHFIYKLNLWE